MMMNTKITITRMMTMKINYGELGELVEKLIRIKDRYDMSLQDRDAISDACNVIYHELIEKNR